ncbi:MAG: hypothetical protein P8X55_08490 [Desulfosarcinaceae bacterium]
MPPNPRLAALGRLSKETAITLLAVTLFTALILIVAGAPPLAAIEALYMGSLGSWIKFSHVIKAWIPLTLCGCGLLFTFRIGLWNIGVEGQVMMGAVFTTWALRLGVDGGSPGLFLGLSFLAAAIGGGIWAFLAGLLKTKGGVNEIFAGLGMNFVAQALILWLIFGPWRRAGVASMSGTEIFPQSLWLTQLPGLRLSPLSLGLVAAAMITTALLLRYTRIGLCLKAIGSNSKSALLFGLQPERYLLLAMLLAGGFAGLAGSLQVSGVYRQHPVAHDAQRGLFPQWRNPGDPGAGHPGRPCHARAPRRENVKGEPGVNGHA